MMTSKELEALKRITSEINNYKLSGIGDKNWLGIQDVLNDINLIENTLTPPTVDEVCRALSERLKKEVPNLFSYKVYHDNGGFHYYDSEDYEIYIAEYDIADKSLCIARYLPPHLITMIGRFYESLEKVGKEDV